MSTRPRAILIHSGGFSSRQWRRLAEGLAPTHEVIAPDLIGYGAARAWPTGKPFHFRQDVAALESLLDEPAHLVGHSYGGLIALHLALARPAAIRSLALYEPVAFGVLDEPADHEAREALDVVSRDFGDGEAWLAQFVNWWNGPNAWAALPAETQASFRAVGWKLFQEVITLMEDPTDRATYATIAAPTLLLGGERSPFPEKRVLEKLAAALPSAELRWFPDAGHMGPITHSPRVNAAILAHIAANS
ncbi:MAG: alpha/beta hydrolase fold protein [Myxococcales bacterium]|nr:alpha/beta hydrolase fold protein [Myxococcales bacterium]